ncbi:YbaK/EbsC family protein [Candidatus Halobonum tyrrellensis]|uniref:YbaK/aminoacyl-tRNA synthetase-associated domain-containing protein n=1 Tax=Candidatus Halobonum tyrrellensis G22 TaxID=1324957 RepID=V4HDY7_9EURY|nr:YbaK/EbsC family protein [Candidatus Halobonum tyrrellensis]ESP88870.1 hypothetical protein K933_06827 [Candidatus Halobonum tyrrellensis G22]
MHPTAARFRERAREECEFDAQVEEFAEGTKTAADAADAVGCDVSQVVKSLVFDTDDGPVVVLTAGHHRVDEDALADALGVETVGFADAETVKGATGWSIGGVPPFPHDSAVPVYLDESLRDNDRVWAAAGTPEAMFPLSSADLERLTDPTPVRAFE